MRHKDTLNDEECIEQKASKKKIKEIWAWILPYIITFIVAIGLLMCFRIVNVEGTSMNDTYQDGDIVVVNSIEYALSNKDILHYGDVIVINPTGDAKAPLIKRVIAVGGDTLDIDFDNGTVTVNDIVLQEDYIKEPTTRNDGGFTYPIKIPEGHYFVMGDNRNNSADSRNAHIGMIPNDKILGKVIFQIPNIFKYF